MANAKTTMDDLGELEPLFDYSRVQPDIVYLDDDDDSDESPVFFMKGRKNSDKLEKKKEKVAETIRCEGKEEEDEDDWLPPPPKISVNASKKLEEDPTIKELRLMKQELQSLAESARGLSQAVEGSAGEKVCSSGQDTYIESMKPPLDRVKVIISIQDKDGLKQFRVYADDKFERIFRVYAEKVKLTVEKLIFCFDGDKVSPLATPESLGMEDNDIIEVHAK